MKTQIDGQALIDALDRERMELHENAKKAPDDYEAEFLLGRACQAGRAIAIVRDMMYADEDASNG